MKRFLVSLTLVGLLALAMGLATAAADPVIPSVTSVTPASAYNDIDTVVTIKGDGFAVETSGAVVTTPTAALHLGATTVQLTNVTWVDTQTLTATVPWGMAAGVYDLTVTNPDQTADILQGAFEVKPGLGNWNAGELNGANVSQLLMQFPGGANPDATRSLYALAAEVGLFRSDDAGASWHFTSANVIGNADFVLDPHHPDWLYRTSSFDGLRVSYDKGDTWPKVLFDTSSNNSEFTTGSPISSEVFVSPNATDTLFLAIYGDDTYVPYKGLRSSTNGGTTWQVVPSMIGTAVQNVAFDPNPNSHDMVLATSDARVFRSTDDGVHWTQVPSPPGITSLGFRGYLMYHPDYKDHPGEVWLVSTETTGGDFKCTITDTVPSWTRAEPSGYTSGYEPTFVGPNDVYVWESHSANDGSTWEPFGPWPTWGAGDFVFNPDDTHTIYFTNQDDGVLKSTTGGLPGPSGEASWTVSNQGLTGMRCSAMAVSSTDPLRVYASFDGWGGVSVSDDGTNSWKYHPIDGSGQLSQVLQDPFDPALVYAVGDGLYTSTNGGTTWPGTGWGLLLPAGSPLGGMGSLAADPDPDPNWQRHLLVACRVSQSSTHDHDLGYLYSSMDGGASWTSVVVTGTAGSIGPIGDIEFDPDTTGTVYLTSDGNGVFKSTDHGAHWGRIDDPKQNMLGASNLAIATHPQHVVAVLAANNLFLSPADGSPTWHDPGSSMGNAGIAIHSFYFVAHDSTRMYAPTYAGLYFSGDLGNTWTRSAGALGGVQVTTLADTVMDGHTLLYAATTGGDAGAVWHTTSAAFASPLATAGTAQTAAIPSSSLVGAGIYRRAEVSQPATYTSTASRDGWVLESSRTSHKGGSVNSAATTLRLGDDKSKRQYRSVLSFSTSGLPDNAIITTVTLMVRKQAVAGGGNPITMFKGLYVDLKNGYFGSSAALQTGDFQASATKSLGTFSPVLSGGWYSIDLTAGSAVINKLSARSGLTQIRLRFKSNDNNNKVANYLSLYSGNAAAYRPQLIVNYYTP
jgi:hypothetical protein